MNHWWREYWLPLLGIVVVSAVLVTTAILVSVAPDWLDERAGITIQAGVLVSLAVITAIYSFHTHHLAREARATRLDSVRPVLVLGRLRGLHQAERLLQVPAVAQFSQRGDQIELKWQGDVVNIGAGPAVRGSVLLVVGSSPETETRSAGGSNKVELPPLGPQHASDIGLAVIMPGATGGSAIPEHGELVVLYQDTHERWMRTRYQLTLGDDNQGETREGSYRVGAAEVSFL